MADEIPPNALHRLSEHYWAFLCEERPLAAVMAGATVDRDVVLREAPEDHDRRARMARHMLAELAAISTDGLEPVQQATHAMLGQELQALITAVTVHAGLRPSLFPLGVEFLLGSALGATSLADGRGAARYVDRLLQVGAALEGVKASLKAGRALGIRWPRIVIDRAAAQIRAAVSVKAAESSYLAPFRQLAGRPDPCTSKAERARAAVDDHVHPALSGFADFLVEHLGGEAARDSIACTDAPAGEDWYRHLIAHFGSTDMHPDDIHRTGLEEVARLSQLCLQAAAEAGFPGDLAAFRTHMAGAPDQLAPSAEALRTRIECLSKQIDGEIPALFGRVPRSTYCIRSIPEALSARLPPAYAQPAPADRSAPGVHWVTSIPERLPAYMHVPLALHEAWPGHLMHVALAQEIDGLPAFRRHGAYSHMASVEGWAVYCEGLGHEMGLLDTPERRYGAAESELWRAVRLVVDTGIHWKGWGREQAIAYMASHLGLPMETLAAEVDRYIGNPAQALSYQLGNLAIRHMRADASARLGSAFRLRAFHDCLMAVGPAPLGILSATVDAWVTSQLD
jgi:uncharacterized protein (DUF885 family)